MRISDWSSDVCSSDLVTFVVPFSPGGSNDIVGRQLATQLSELWGQPVVVENRPGAGATVGSAHVAAQPADGYTIMIASVTFTMNPAVQQNLPFDPATDFTPVAMIRSEESRVGQESVSTCRSRGAAA